MHYKYMETTGNCKKCGTETYERHFAPYDYCENCCPHDEYDYDQHSGGINSCHGCGHTWKSYDND